jgi:hypothetical protein
VLGATYRERDVINVIKDIWASMRALPLWVQIWVFVILVPVNFATISFLGEPNGVLIACLAIVGILPNAFFMFWERGFSRIMALSHIIFWIPLVVIVSVTYANLESGPFATFCIILLVVDLISLVFDIKDGLAWFKGDREVVRP